MTEPLSSRFPEPLDNDDDDVAWALQTAKVMWQRGAQADAIVWLRRAADTADQQSNVWRAADLRRSADELSAKMGTRPAFSRPPPVSSRAPGSSDIDALLGQSDQALPLPSYAALDEPEVEVEPESFDEIVIEETGVAYRADQRSRRCRGPRRRRAGRRDRRGRTGRGRARSGRAVAVVSDRAEHRPRLGRL